MKLPHHILFLFILIISACTSQVDEQLRSAEEYYIEHHAINDSIDNALSQMVTTSGTSQDVMKRILHATYLFKSGGVEEAFSEFESLSREMNDDITPYWHAVVEDYLGLIYLNSGLAQKARPHFYKVLECANATKDERHIAQANSHLSCYHQVVGEHDSALYYASKVLTYENVLDSQMLAIAYQNLAVIQTSIAQSSNTDILGTLQLSRQFNMGTADSLLTHALMAQAYYLRGRIDSARIYQHEVESGKHDISKLILYKFLADYHDQEANTDSAYKYLKLYSHLDSLCVQKGLVEPLLNTVHEHNEKSNLQRFTKQIALVIIVCVCTILLVIICLRIAHRRRLDKVYKEIERLSTQIQTSSAHDETSAETAPAQQPAEEASNRMQTEEEAYRDAKICQQLQKNAIEGRAIRPEELESLEECIKTVSPDFYSKIHSLHKVSPIEYNVSLLIRARFTPMEISTLLCKSRSGVSSIRSRLYNKVFGEKGSPTDWDDFILSL